MVGIGQEIERHRISVKDRFRETTRSIVVLYQKQLSLKSRQIDRLVDSLRRKQEELDSAHQENTSLRLQIEGLESMMANLEDVRLASETASRLEREQWEQKCRQLSGRVEVGERELGELRQRWGAEVREKEEQIRRLHNMTEAMSLDISTVSRNEGYSFSQEISSVFRNSPHEMLKFLQSIPGEVVGEEKQVGDMTAMFVSRDGESLQKYLRVNRTFLKKKIKEHQRRFRFVLIYKPDKA